MNNSEQQPHTDVVHSEMKFGRRKEDKAIMNEMMLRLSQSYQHAEVSRAPARQGRRPRRTRAQLRSALSRAIAIVKAANPEWEDKRIRVRARNLVRLYEVI